ncbi:hypothetical protein Patl1_05848 [Pistacia atlantica]|uniref:Uncharacterized protein n=1 Tax=Pistacia atlantica TaxID=434234 RepID=A0ACC1BPZ0_9ROSI|nr:hypothetical protein Patl1_05848 [Pistacia atlantica]
MQKYRFLLKFTGKEEEINLLGDGNEKPEFGQWSWMSPEQVIEQAVDFKKPVYKGSFYSFHSLSSIILCVKFFAMLLSFHTWS